MEITEGLGRQAEVWVDGNLMTVCDGISPHGRRCPPGVLQDVTFSYVSVEGFSWAEALQGNRAHKKRLDAVRGWSYIGYGQVVSIMPVVIDFGLLRMEDANWTTDERLVGHFVRVPIDRLDIGLAHEPDWPEEMR